MRARAVCRGPWAASWMLMVAACGGGPPPPARLDTRNDSCAWCRMSVSDPRFAAQLVAPAEEPRFFDDIGCLRDYLAAAGARVGEDAVAYVADHRTRTWAGAATAVYGRCAQLETPMSSHLVAHADAASRAADPAASGCASLTLAEVFGTALPPAGARP